MSDYIKREDALEAVNELCEDYAGNGMQNYHPHIDFVIFSLEHIPPADVEPVRHGRWLYTPTAWAYCSVCGSEPPNESNSITAYCPNCGARMDGDADPWKRPCKHFKESGDAE